MVLVPPKKLLATLWLSFLCTVFAPPIHAQQSVIFASVDEGRRILGARDSFIEAMSPFDRAARMKTDRGISEIEFLEFVKKSVLEWNSTEISTVQSA
jgi:hypothetical protein